MDRLPKVIDKERPRGGMIEARDQMPVHFEMRTRAISGEPCDETTPGDPILDEPFERGHQLMFWEMSHEVVEGHENVIHWFMRLPYREQPVFNLLPHTNNLDRFSSFLNGLASCFSKRPIFGRGRRTR